AVTTPPRAPSGVRLATSQRRPPGWPPVAAGSGGGGGVTPGTVPPGSSGAAAAPRGPRAAVTSRRAIGPSDALLRLPLVPRAATSSARPIVLRGRRIDEPFPPVPAVRPCRRPPCVRSLVITRKRAISLRRPGASWPHT